VICAGGGCQLLGLSLIFFIFFWEGGLLTLAILTVLVVVF
jgi:hypothetical protein